MTNLSSMGKEEETENTNDVHGGLRKVLRQHVPGLPCDLQCGVRTHQSGGSTCTKQAGLSGSRRFITTRLLKSAPVSASLCGP